MALDPQVKTLLDALATFDQARLTARTVEVARGNLEMMSKLNFLPRPVVGDVSDHEIEVPSGRIRLRIYRPSTVAVDDAVAVFFHGGGFVTGNLDTHDILVRSLCEQSGVVFVSVEYGLAPENPFPGPVMDSMVALSWVLDARASITGVNDARIALVGDSAGGNIAAVLAQLLRKEGSKAVALQVLVYPVTDFTARTGSAVENAQGYFLTREDMEWFVSLYMDEDTDVTSPLASPLLASDLAGLPPALVVVAEFDPLRDQGIAYADALRNAGVHVDLWMVEGMVHGFYSMELLIDKARATVTDTAIYLRDALSASVDPRRGDSPSAVR